VKFDPKSAKSIFLAALEKPVSERAALLDETIGGDDALRARVEALLRAHDDPDGFLERSVAQFTAIDHSSHAAPIVELPGTLIGPYKLLEKIGEGGMGVVYMADQQSPVRRRVAVKIIKAGMDTAQVIARFEAERQALAIMDHTSIARVFDAGATNSGHPYFVMELVRGIPITDYCDQNNLPIRQRLELFVQVCGAVQHAHQKGIIHRDIKPSNVLVSVNDGRAVTKIIDFGVAKATNQQLTERTLFTAFAQMVGTPLYMSPEQADMTSVDIDTRSDIYSLGVLLYELLTGTTPFDPQRLRQSAFDEVRRIIREEEPPKPSLRISTLGDARSVTAAHRQVDFHGLDQLVQGDLDWIVTKSLEKDRSRRYETANDFAADIWRHLGNEPVEACPPSNAYRLRKFVRRNRVAFVAGALIMVSLLVAVAGITAGIGWAIRDRAARQEQAARQGAARRAKVTGQLDLILDEVARLEQAEKWPEALTSAQRAEPALATEEVEPDVEQRAREVLADLKLVGQIEDIRMMSGTAWADGMPSDAQTDSAYASTFRNVGIDVDVLPVKIAADRIAAHHAITAALIPALDDWVAVRSHLKDQNATRRLVELLQVTDSDAWRLRMRDALAHNDWPALQKLASAPELDQQPAATLSFLAAGLRGTGHQWDTEIAVLRRAQWKYPADFWINHRLGIGLVFSFTPRGVEEGIGFLHAAVAVRPQSAHALMNLGVGYDFAQQPDDALACFRRALELEPEYAACYENIGDVLNRQGHYGEALAALEQANKIKPGQPCDVDLSCLLSDCPDVRLRQPRRAVELARRAVEASDQRADSWRALGIAQYRLQAWQEALTALEKAAEIAPASRSAPLDIEDGAVDDSLAIGAQRCGPPLP
jgi:serine/threonine protein kinase/tetratricopeptide (TPR) repeat protein